MCSEPQALLLLCRQGRALLAQLCWPSMPPGMPELRQDVQRPPGQQQRPPCPCTASLQAGSLAICQHWAELGEDLGLQHTCLSLSSAWLTATGMANDRAIPVIAACQQNMA